MGASKKDYLTFVASEWADPISDLVHSWKEHMLSRPELTHLTPRDHGRCCALVLLLVVLLESYTLRAEVDSGSANERETQRFSAFRWWTNSAYNQREEVLDAFVVRDALAHNHLYEFDTPDDFLHLKGGDPKFKARVSNGRLLHTALSCNPHVIGPTEVIRLSGIVAEALLYLKQNYRQIGDVRFGFARRGSHGCMWDVVCDAAGHAIRVKSVSV